MGILDTAWVGPDMGGDHPLIFMVGNQAHNMTIMC